MTTPAVVEIDHRDPALQAAFCDYVPRVFRTVDFRRWCAWGGWNDDYRAFSVLDEGRVVANASVMRMRLRVEGREIIGYQFGAVGCVPSHRGRGLSRVVMRAALESCGEAPVLLFANENVLGFYPRFGFTPRTQALFGAAFHAVPGGEPAPVLELEEAQVRSGLVSLSEEGLPVTDHFGSRGHARIASWYAANAFSRPLRQLHADAWVFAGVEDGTLYIDDIFAREPFDLRPHIPRLIDQPITAVHFGFTPERWWPRAEVVGEDSEAYLFVRNLGPPSGPHRFPVMART
ncbi:acetyltransferase, GNAT family [Cystobacter fuscus DSM 2262]|uniref:Acetyltransferase, GNAT family n=1 Tax=Cystobacter fuscus (strain ATCC 25194 / DSM 2262 / NBRC 100088 / M29) TaxID=1242864 RepID=S9PGK4_CYSF2|nr:GNAT family N-acetyltransferase [Cystobacter fuscus]EPX62191.1 acetyltransferase, GNAT family [Cystobacter fuscus DSM 2262]